MGLDFTIYIYLSLSLSVNIHSYVYIYTYVLKHWYLQIFVCFYFVLHACGFKYWQMPNAHTHISYIYIYLSIWLLIKIPFSGNGHSSRINMSLSRTPCFSLAEPMLGNNASHMKIHSSPDYHGSLLDRLVSMQLASRNPFSGQDDC